MSHSDANSWLISSRFWDLKCIFISKRETQSTRKWGKENKFYICCKVASSLCDVVLVCKKKLLSLILFNPFPNSIIIFLHVIYFYSLFIPNIYFNLCHFYLYMLLEINKCIKSNQRKSKKKVQMKCVFVLWMKLLQSSHKISPEYGTIITPGPSYEPWERRTGGQGASTCLPSALVK